MAQPFPDNKLDITNNPTVREKKKTNLLLNHGKTALKPTATKPAIPINRNHAAIPLTSTKNGCEVPMRPPDRTSFTTAPTDNSSHTP